VDQPLSHGHHGAGGAALAAELYHRLTHSARFASALRFIIGIGGESGSGKSVTATNLAAKLNEAGLRCEIIHQDDYFLRPPRVNHAFRCEDLRHVGPHEVNLGLIAQHLSDFRAGRRSVAAPRVDYPGDRFLERTLDFADSRALILEGTYVLTLPGLDFRVFLEATHVETRERRRVRNRDLDEPIIGDILEIEHRLIAPQRHVADVVIDRDFRVRQ
jgi:uridine kinase